MTMLPASCRARLTALACAAALASCAPTTAPAPPAQEYLVVVNGDDGSLSMGALGTDAVLQRVALGRAVGAASRIATRGIYALVSTGSDGAVAVVSLRQRAALRIIRLGPGATAAGLAILNDSVAFVANASANRVTRFNYLSGDTASVEVRGGPTGLLLTRGRLFVTAFNGLPCTGPVSCTAGPSWLRVLDPASLAPDGGRDSIPLTGSGGATALQLGDDGLVYVLSAGTEVTEGRLSLVDPLTRNELGSFAGIGVMPRRLVAGLGGQLFLGSPSEGILQFDTRRRTLVRGAGQGIPLVGNTDLAIDHDGNIYATETPGCGSGLGGRVRIFRPDLTEMKARFIGNCPVALGIALVPPPPAD